MSGSLSVAKPSILDRSICPHCWTEFPPDTTLWVSSHQDLLGDDRLGDDAQRRFLPDRFNAAGRAIDLRGMPCEELACPHCHLTVPPSLFEVRSVFMSILGAPGSGKSYLLASMVWQMSQTLLRRFRLAFLDADPTCNQTLRHYQELLFLPDDPHKLVALRKTELNGELYQSVNYDGQQVFYPRPFLFTVEPSQSHPHFDQRTRLGRQLVLYDNAGEHFMPGRESASSPGTRHMRLSGALMFVYDPTQDVRLRRRLAGVASDPQLTDNKTYPQDQILAEAARRIRLDGQMGTKDAFDKPLIVVVSKFDLWRSLLPAKLTEDMLYSTAGPASGAMNVFSVKRLMKVSAAVRDLLCEATPEIVSTAEAFSRHVVYVPVSAQGCSSERDPKTSLLGVRPQDLKPFWCDVPLTYALLRTTQGMIPRDREDR